MKITTITTMNNNDNYNNNNDNNNNDNYHNNNNYNNNNNRQQWITMTITTMSTNEPLKVVLVFVGSPGNQLYTSGVLIDCVCCWLLKKTKNNIAACC